MLRKAAGNNKVGQGWMKTFNRNVVRADVRKRDQIEAANKSESRRCGDMARSEHVQALLRGIARTGIVRGRKSRAR